MDVYEKLINKETKLSVVGLGYVGLPIAVEFAKKIDVIGFDINERKIANYKDGLDATNEIGNDALKGTKVNFTSEPAAIKDALFHIVAVPTPINGDHTPDLSLVKNASRILGRNLVKGSIVVYESTVYPGVTEEICVPILEKESKMKCGEDFKVGYSPERINPGDKNHSLSSITKVVSGMDNETLDIISKAYGLVVKAGVYPAPSIKVAEAAKVIENSQRDINIAFMNELSMIFHRLGIDTREVLAAASTKWNFLNFYPGLVGGHCIGVDPYYLTYKAESSGYYSQIILSGRRINDGMGKYIADNLIKNLVLHDIKVKGAKVAVFGFTFKENCPDTRNTKVKDIYDVLSEYGIELLVVDPVADLHETRSLYGINMCKEEDVKEVDAVVVAVAHKKFMDYTPENLSRLYKNNAKKIVFDIKGIFDRELFENKGYEYWRL